MTRTTGRVRQISSLFLLALVTGTACGVTEEDRTLPPNVQDPEILKTPAGAVARYREVLGVLASTFDGVMTVGGTLTDELRALPTPERIFGVYTRVDSREDLSGVTIATKQYGRLHRLRAQAQEARGFLAAYAPDSSPALRAHLYAIEGYAEIFLADLFCSGIPLSRVDFDGDFTMASGSTTSEVYEHAVALFDSALTLSQDSLRFQHLSAVGRARALLGLGRNNEAATAASTVPDDYRYQTIFSWPIENAFPDSATLFWYANMTGAVLGSSRVGALSMGDLEGGTGLDYRSSGDPRTLPWTVSLTDLQGNSIYFPRKYTPNGTASAPPGNTITFVMASGIEARLIEAEAALQANSGDGVWLDRLNHLRQTAGPSIVPASGPLSVLSDPGTDPDRLDLLFRERAFWLYLTAQRQGDLRRLVRKYSRDLNEVYPSGPYAGGQGFYGLEVTVPVPLEEAQFNPNYTGCFHRGA